MKRRVVITGMGTINPIGHNLEETWANVKAGVCGIDEIKNVDTTNFKLKLAAEVKDYTPEEFLDKKEAKKMDRYTQFATIAAREAMKDSGINIEEEDPYRCGTIISSGIGGLITNSNEHSRGLERGFEKISPFYIPMTIANMAAGQIAIETGFKGICTCVVPACVRGNNAIGEAFRNIRDGYTDVMMCGGSEGCICEMGIGGFTVMHALNLSTDKNRASIPFDAERSGFVMGEGAGILMLEELEHAKKRGAKLRPEDVDYINAHGTSTPLNDAGETKAIKAAFGDHAYKLMVSSTKSMTGHLLGGSGAVEAIITTKALQEGFVPATINYQVPDPNCDLDIVPNEGRNADIKVALSNSLGFGGHNATTAFKKWEEE